MVPSLLLLGCLIDLFLLLKHFFIEVFIMIVANKSLLNVFLVQKLHILQNLFAVLIFPLSVSVGSVKIVFIWWSKWTLDPLVQKIIPWEISHPRVILDIFWSIQSKSVQRLSLDQSVDKISRFNTPTRRNFRSLNLDLLGKDMLSDLSSISASIGSSSKHTFISDNTHSKVVDSNTMWLFAHNFWRHIAWCS